MKLKMRNISNLDTFFKVINQCDGAVELSLPESTVYKGLHRVGI